ncbi:MAG: DUF1003 domain-containing protein [Anaerolineaceae bacterium]|nr:DUF1003 domain-containing protein [Anaerolineaceae bacterium]
MPIAPNNLKSVKLFELMDDSELEELAAHIDEASFAPSQILFKAGDKGDSMHILLSGKVETFVYDGEANRIKLSEVDEGGIVGELSLLDNQPRSATAIAVEETRTFIIDRDDLKRLFQKKPEAALDILAVLGHRIRETDTLLISRASMNANEEIDERLTFGQRIADKVASFGGSWNFIISFGAILLIWIVLNTMILSRPFDGPPFILLNLILSMLAALQAPVIMMSQNRQDAKDRIRSELDYKVNLKSELEIKQLHEKIDSLELDIKQRFSQINSTKSGT